MTAYRPDPPKYGRRSDPEPDRKHTKMNKLVWLYFLGVVGTATAETTVSVGVDDWDANNSSTNANHMFINVSGADGIDLIMGGSLASGNQAGSLNRRVEIDSSTLER